MRILRTLFIATVAIFASTMAFGQSTSVYTSTKTSDCRSIKQSDESSYLGVCPGVAGYKLQLIEGDIRQTINVVFPNKKISELTLWSTVGSGFSAVGEKVEWRVKKSGKTLVPYALIIRYNVADPEDSTKSTSYLAVAKIERGKACVVDVVEPQAKQNEKARELADASAGKPCKE